MVATRTYNDGYTEHQSESNIFEKDNAKNKTENMLEVYNRRIDVNKRTRWGLAGQRIADNSG